MNKGQTFVDALGRVVKRNYANPNYDVSSMAAEMKISDRQLQRKTKTLTGQTPVQYLRAFRLDKSLQLLREGIAVGKAAKAVGFSSHAYFTSCFKDKFGIKPSRLRGSLRKGES
jgi:AraC-like DNA-binding protein